MTTAHRLAGIDMLRGLAIVLMTLDHTRDYFGAAPFDTEDLAQTSALWFATRWVTHLCAPAFVLLAGISAYLRGTARGKPALARYLATRGALLLLLEATWISFSWEFNFDLMTLGVLWALGAGMLVLAALVWLPLPVIALFALWLIGSHNLLDSIRSSHPLWLAWHQRGLWHATDHLTIFFNFPLMPWIGLIAAGYVLGRTFEWEAQRRQRFLFAAGATLLLAFVVLRSGNFYGDPDPWSPQGRGPLWDVISFIRVHKHPPSLLYLCLTLGIVLPLLAWCERLRPVPLLMLFGSASMFFYLVHIALIHFLSLPYFMLRYGAPLKVSVLALIFPRDYEPSLSLVYGTWAAVLLIMYGLTMLWTRLRRHYRSATSSGTAKNREKY
jgi:uncharacterized membrane protein